MQEKDEATQEENNSRIVDTSRADYVGLNLREQPIIEENIIKKIPHGATINIIGDKIKDDNREWVKVEYIDKSGTEFKGWVSTEYLKEIEQKEQEKVQNIETNATGNVTGIDISGMSPEYLRELLEKGIPETVDAKIVGETDTTQLEGKINFAIIKLGKSSYGKGKLKINNYSGYEEQAKVCEEMGVPFGFYYYSTSINEEEAEMELKYITEELKRLREEYDYKYNTIPPVIDVELTNEKDRQYGQNIKNLSYAKAHIINGLQEEGICDKVLIYAPGRVMDPDDSDQLIDLDIIKQKSDNWAIWLCSPIKANGKNVSTNEHYYDLIENQYGVDIANRQMVLDATIDKGSYELVDINNMETEYYCTLQNEDGER